MSVPVTGKTVVYGIFGDPVAHSLSPVMQNAAFRHCGIDAVYVPFHIRPPDLPAAVAALRILGIAGINVTIPHKEMIIPLLDQLDPTAACIGAVNTVVNNKGVLTGYNTDSSGFLRSAQEELGFVAKNSKVLILGAGGACRAVVHALLTEDISSLTVANRHQERAQELLSAFTPAVKTLCPVAVGYETPEYYQSVTQADLIVNTTSVGLNGEKLDFFPLENIKGSALIYDMVYSFAGTPLTAAARARGYGTVDGLSLLAAQGEDAFYLWAREILPAGFMRQQLQNYQRTVNENGKG